MELSAKHNLHTKEQIIKQASKIFAKSGFDGASLSQIAKLVGIKKASVYYFFKSKQELFAACQETLWSDLSKFLQRKQLLMNSKNTNQDFAEILEQILNANLKAGLVAFCPIHCNGKVKAYVTGMRKQLYKFLLSQKIKNPKSAENLVIFSIHGFVSLAQFKKISISTKKFSQYLSQLILQTYGKF